MTRVEVAALKPGDRVRWERRGVGDIGVVKQNDGIELWISWNNGRNSVINLLPYPVVGPDLSELHRIAPGE